MALTLSNLKAAKTRKKKRVGRGDATGRGTYAGRGLKGQRSRSGGKNKLRRRGLKQFLAQIPKSRGFNSPHKGFASVNVGDIAKRFDAGAIVNPTRLLQNGLTKSKKRIAILGHGTLDKKITVQAHRFSKAAENAITKAGGVIQIIPITKAAPKKKQQNK